MKGTVVDIETTGFSRSDEITSITLIKFDDYIIDSIYSTLVNPGRRIPIDVEKLTGITNVMVLGFPKFNEILNTIKTFIDGRYLFAYNASFEAKFLNSRYKIMDVLNPCRKIFDLPSYKLRDVGKFLKLDLGQSHTSLSDALLCYNIICVLKKRGYDFGNS
jgi:DNA polymerase-3 subunit alpha (Gram-positive type)